eukprot:m.1402026 g.1402026  ORF g.1402026 m.1402026 type:complete len:549 (+) comp25009_c0_seq26:146-1792(+)
MIRRRTPLGRSLCFCLSAAILFVWMRQQYPKCGEDQVYCNNGLIVHRQGPECAGYCDISRSQQELSSFPGTGFYPWAEHEDESDNHVIPVASNKQPPLPSSQPLNDTLYSLVLWNAPMHSWTGTASEAIDFVVPLSSVLPNLALVGGYSEKYVHGLTSVNQRTIEQLRSRGDFFTQNQSAILNRLKTQQDPSVDTTSVQMRPSSGGEVVVRTPLQQSLSSIFITQYDPGTYQDDLRRYFYESFDYTVGRPMFETTGLPAGWVAACELMDELWVPSRWGRNRFIKAGVEARKLFVIPQAVDTTVFDPKRVRKDPTLMDGVDKTFAFLSVFKWENRKNYEALLTAFLVEFRSSDPVTLYIRGGERRSIVDNYVYALKRKLAVSDCASVKWIPHVSHAQYPQLFKNADAFVLPTHGEGWGRPVMEAMAMELPTIVTYWSGQTEFVTEATAFLLRPSGLEPGFFGEPALLNFDDQANHQWATVSVLDLRRIMRYVSREQNKDQVRDIGKRARKRIVRLFSRDAVRDLVLQRLKAIQRTIAARHQASINTWQS